MCISNNYRLGPMTDENTQINAFGDCYNIQKKERMKDKYGGRREAKSTGFKQR
jgi:hypothetical protein